MPITDPIEDAIVSSIEDVELPEPTEDPTPAAPVEVAPEAASEPTAPVPEAPKAEVKPPTVDEVDPFDKKYGLTRQSAEGRENRIPYSRVKKIADNAAKEAAAAEAKKFETHVPATKFAELETENKDYKTRLTQVSEFERIMVEDAPRFLTMLYTKLPQSYQRLLEPLFQPQAAAPAQASASTPQGQPDGDMPLPDQTLSDGSKVYSMEGLKALLGWQAQQVETRVTKQVESRYAPMESDYQRHQQIQNALPKVQQQIQDARTWPQFNENEADIVKALRDNPSFSLERAYQAVVLPRLQAQRDQMRAELLQEVKQAPRSTAAPTTAFKAAPPVKNGPQSVEDVVADAIKGIQR